MDLLEWIYRNGFAGVDPQKRIGWSGFAGDDQREWIYRRGFAGMDLQDWIRWCGSAGADWLLRIAGVDLPGRIRRIRRRG